LRGFHQELSVFFGFGPMVTVHFLRSDGTEIYKAGPVPWLRAVDGSLRAWPDGKEIARYEGGIWNAEGHAVAKCVIHASTCTVRYESDNPDDSTAHGPYDTVEFVDGSVFAQPGRHLLAHLDEGFQEWYSYEDKRSWPKLVVAEES
jgi:hypothetical protein